MISSSGETGAGAVLAWHTPAKKRMGRATVALAVLAVPASAVAEEIKTGQKRFKIKR